MRQPKANNGMTYSVIAFAFVLCLAMLAGEIYSGNKNPVALVFYTFLPTVFGMIANEQKSKTGMVRDLQIRIEKLEKLGHD